ncbi:hypothetical protein [Ferrimonas aestuarii]|uniref:hypothetical protein n=1 Tax=Ferrimonas aestuarii TaxID=2569539 RepID=UPI00145D4B29|nr:hypothetical protein [Ferrimonas aestuarii]
MESTLTVVLLLLVATLAIGYFLIPHRRKHRPLTPVSNRSRKKRARKKTAKAKA